MPWLPGECLRVTRMTFGRSDKNATGLSASGSVFTGLHTEPAETEGLPSPGGQGVDKLHWDT